MSARLLIAFLATMALQCPAADYFELRIYDVAPNKTAAVLERFRDTVEPIRRKHGIETVGLWTNVSPGSEKFIYLLKADSREELQKREKAFGADPDFQKGYAASNAKHGKTVAKITAIPLTLSGTERFDFTPAPEPRVFDLRIYTIIPDKLDSFEKRWRDHAVRIYERHGLHSVGWWRAAEKDGEGNDRVICLLAGDSLESINKSISDFHSDPEWQRVEAESERDGKLRSAVGAYKVQPVDFSKLK